MKTFKEYLKETNFSDIFGEYKPSKVIKIDPPQQKDVMLDLYRGFDADIDNLEKQNDKYILSPHKGEQHAIWFSQHLKDAKGRGEWILKYQLKAIKHYQRVYLEDGTHYDKTPPDIEVKEDPLENSTIWNGIELPDGWLWSYKTQKYIISEKPILITKDMIKKDNEYNENL